MRIKRLFQRIAIFLYVLNGLTPFLTNILFSNYIFGNDKFPTEAVQALLRVDSFGQGNEKVQENWSEVAAISLEQIPQLLDFFDQANPIAANGLDLAIQSALERELEISNKKGPVVQQNFNDSDALESLDDSKNVESYNSGKIEETNRSGGLDAQNNLTHSVEIDISEKFNVSEKSVVSEIIDEFPDSVVNFFSCLENYLFDESKNVRGRKIALRILQDYLPKRAIQIQSRLLDDSVGEMRFDAIAHELSELAAKSSDTESLNKESLNDKSLFNNELLNQYEKLYEKVVDYQQLITIAEQLFRLNSKRYPFAETCGFVSHWQIVGPFDNSFSQGFQKEYEPEKIDWIHQSLNEMNSYSFEGKNQSVQWKSIQTDDQWANVDFNQLLSDEKDVLAYAMTTIEFPDAARYSFRIASENAIKIWLNGKLIGSEEIYHGQEEPDQYIFEDDVIAGSNVILVKVCQNNQPQSYAGVWRMRLRICNAVGSPYFIKNR